MNAGTQARRMQMRILRVRRVSIGGGGG